MSVLYCWLDPPMFCIIAISMMFIICWCAWLSSWCICSCDIISLRRIVISSHQRASSASLTVWSASLKLCLLRCCIIIIPIMFGADKPPLLTSSSSPVYLFLPQLIGAHNARRPWPLTVAVPLDPEILPSTLAPQAAVLPLRATPIWLSTGAAVSHRQEERGQEECRGQEEGQRHQPHQQRECRICQVLCLWV